MHFGAFLSVFCHNCDTHCLKIQYFYRDTFLRQLLLLNCISRDELIMIDLTVDGVKLDPYLRGFF